MEIVVAAGRGDVQAVTKALASGEDVNWKTAYGDTALLEASENGHDSVVALLLEHGADVNARRTSGETPLVAAVWRRHMDVAKRLLASGADPNVRFNGGPLLLFAYYPRPYKERTPQEEETDRTLVRMLLDAGTDPNERADDGGTFLTRCREPVLIAYAKGESPRKGFFQGLFRR